MILRVMRSKASPKQQPPVGAGTTTELSSPPVCVVEQNRLAARYLLEMLAKNPALHAVTLEELIAHKASEAVAPSFHRGSRRNRFAAAASASTSCANGTRLQGLSSWTRNRAAEHAVYLLALGVHGFVSYAQIDEQLSQAVERVTRGELWFSPSVLEAYARNSIASLKAVSQSPTGQAITQRESQIIELVKRRLSNKEIAEVLHIQESTVKFHLSNIFSKLQVNRRNELQDRGQLSDIWRKLIAS